MSQVRGVDVSIMGREFRVACAPDEQKSLQEAVDYLNRKMQEIKDQGKINGLDRIAIMAALNIAHELLTTRTGGFDIGDFKRRINAMQEQIDQAVDEQNALF